MVNPGLTLHIDHPELTFKLLISVHLFFSTALSSGDQKTLAAMSSPAFFAFPLMMHGSEPSFEC